MAETSLADLRMSALVELIASNAVSPGAGAAGAVTLALAAACGAKAASISLKHSPDEPRLAAALTRFRTLGRYALLGADSDSRAFADFIRDKSAKAAGELVETGEALGCLTDALLSAIEEVEPRVERSMAGDLIAARALASAARTIQSANEAQAKEEQQTAAGEERQP